MSHLGAWTPATIEERMDRMESLAEIRQLPMRYALAVDSRDIATLAALFTRNVRVGGDRSGRAALAEWFRASLSTIGVSVHVVANHTIEFESAELARGVVYCRDEIERPENGDWQVGMLQYHDTYRRDAGQWFFERRRFHRWYQVDALDRPAPGAGMDPITDPLTTVPLPYAFPSWDRFWAEIAQSS